MRRVLEEFAAAALVPAAVVAAVGPGFLFFHLHFTEEDAIGVIITAIVGAAVVCFTRGKSTWWSVVALQVIGAVLVGAAARWGLHMHRPSVGEMAWDGVLMGAALCSPVRSLQKESVKGLGRRSVVIIGIAGVSLLWGCFATAVPIAVFLCVTLWDGTLFANHATLESVTGPLWLLLGLVLVGVALGAAPISCHAPWRRGAKSIPEAGAGAALSIPTLRDYIAAGRSAAVPSVVFIGNALLLFATID
jgi:hypothetical protein